MADPEAAKVVEETVALAEEPAKASEETGCADEAAAPKSGLQTFLKVFVLDQPVLTCFHIFLPFAIWMMFTMKEGDAQSESWAFMLCLLAIVPLAERLGFATEEVSKYTGETVAGLLNATFGNVPELVVTIIAIAHGKELVAIQTLVGGVLSALLIVSGLSAFFGGIKNKVQQFNVENASGLLHMVMLVAVVVSLTTLAEMNGYGTFEEMDTRDKMRTVSVVTSSRIIAIICLLIYGAFLFFSLYTHKELFEDAEKDDDEEEEEPELGLYTALGTMVVLVGIISWLSDGMVASIEGAAEHSGIPQLVICTLIIPNVNNAPEHSVAVLMAWNNRIDASIATSVGSAAQLAILMIPIAIIADWIGGGDLDFGMEPILAGGLVFGALFAMFVLSSGKSTWIHGLMLLTGYAAIIVAFFLESDIANKGIDNGGTNRSFALWSTNGWRKVQMLRMNHHSHSGHHEQLYPRHAP